MSGKKLNLNRKMYETSKISFFDNFLLVCESVRELGISKAPEDLSTYAVGLLKKNFVVF